MRKVIVTEFLTLDGMYEELSSWRDGHDADDGAFKHDELFASGGLLLGRGTYEGFAQYWPGATDTGDFGDRMNSLPKYVATTTLKDLEWNATALEGDVVSAVETLKKQEGHYLLV